MTDTINFVPYPSELISNSEPFWFYNKSGGIEVRVCSERLCNFYLPSPPTTAYSPATASTVINANEITTTESGKAENTSDILMQADMENTETTAEKDNLSTSPIAPLKKSAAMKLNMNRFLMGMKMLIHFVKL